MDKKKYSIIISTCDKFSDLWDAYFYLLEKNWPDRTADTYLVTDLPTNKAYDNVKIIAAGEGTEITERLRKVMPLIDTNYILFTLDDYFLTERIITDRIIEDIEIMERNRLGYLRLLKMSKKALKNRKAVVIEPDIYLLDNYAGDYIVSLYTGIWQKNFMEKTLNTKMNAWQYEVALTGMARSLEIRCADSRREEFPILDVIRKGKVLSKARKYFQKNPIYNGNRQNMRVIDEWKIKIRTWLREWLPKPLFKALKKRMRKKGHVFFSE